MSQDSQIDLSWLRQALILASQAPKECIYCVGCVIIDQDNKVIATGFTGESTYEADGLQPSLPHAEEVALKKLEFLDLGRVTLYSTMEPCSERKSGRTTCTQRIIESGIRRVVFGALEPFDPKLGIQCKGREFLDRAGVRVLQMSELADECLRVAKKGL